VEPTTELLARARQGERRGFDALFESVYPARRRPAEDLLSACP
jgi:hypothetical protein